MLVKRIFVEERVEGVIGDDRTEGMRDQPYMVVDGLALIIVLSVNHMEHIMDQAFDPAADFGKAVQAVGGHIGGDIAEILNQETLDLAKRKKQASQTIQIQSPRYRAKRRNVRPA